jgi:predicted TIM-barrel fold metal-dependent hydrolase
VVKDRPELVDCHVHFWDVATQDRGWITGEWSPSQAAYLGDYTSLKRTFVLEDLLPYYTAERVVKAIHVQADWGGDQVDETLWVHALARRAGFPIGIVAGADLRLPNVRAELERHCEAGPVRGVRMLGYYAADNLYEDVAFLRGLGQLGQFDLLFEIGVMWDRLDDALALAKRFGSLQFVLDHAGMPLNRDSEALNTWRHGLRAVASCDNVAVKISGLGMGKHRLTADAMGPIVGETLDAFGSERAMLGSNWPVDSLFGDYSELLASFEELTRGLSAAEQWSVWRGTAERIYRL